MVRVVGTGGAPLGFVIGVTSGGMLARAPRGAAELGDLVEPPGEEELEALMWELDLRPRQAIQGKEEL